MGRTLYQYNPHTCRYEPEEKSGLSIAKRTITFLTLSLIVGSAAFLIYYNYSHSVSEIWLKQRNTILRKDYVFLEKRAEHNNRQLLELIHKDDNNYRIILDTSPLPASIREAGIGGREQMNQVDEDLQLIQDSYKRIDKLKRQVDIEVQSYADIRRLLDEKRKMWASRPAIQPIDNRQLDKLHLTFGLRLHPIFHTLMDHKGLDFTAPRGTPVYATGDGVVAEAHFSGSYGNVVYISHGQGFETRYAHLSKFVVAKRDSVTRGQVIGYVGNTGNSVSAHLHYEVLINGDPVNPISFFQRDLSNDEYEKLIQLGSEKSDPLD